MHKYAYLSTLILIGIVLVVVANAQEVIKEDIPGIRNFARVGTTVACGGTIEPAAVPELKKLGFVAVFNLRQASEAGEELAQEETAVKAAGLNYVHLPFNSRAPEPQVADRFLEEIVKPENQPAYIHCGGGPRAAAMWFIKRIVIDSWETEKASAEALQLGLTHPRLKQFALDYINEQQEK